MTAFALVKSKRTLRRAPKVKPLLAALGLPVPCRWPMAAARIKALIVEARNDGDDQLAAQLSEIKSLFKAKLLNECACGQAITSGANKCKMCRTIN